MTKIAACMIVKDSARTIEACLESIRPFVDEINIYDTGSKDGTSRILEKLGKRTHVYLTPEGTLEPQLPKQPENRPPALPDGWQQIPLAPIRVQKGEWRDDFAWARQESFDMASEECDWLLWLDDDDVIQGAHFLRQIANAAHPSQNGFVFFYDYARDENGQCVCHLWRERLMRRSAGWRWQGAVHEVLCLDDGDQIKFQLVPGEQVRYIHNRPPDKYAPDRNLRILERVARECEEQGEQPDPRTLAYLGTESMTQLDFQNAALYLQRYLQHPAASWGDERIQVYAKLAGALNFLGQPEAAVEVSYQALRERDDWPETALALTESFFQLKQWDRVRHWAKRVIELGVPQTMLIVNPLAIRFLPLTRLAEADAEQGRMADAIGWLQQAAQVMPGDPYIQAKIAACQTKLFENEVVKAVLLLREAAVRFDENLKAWHILENVPYFIADRPEIVKAVADQREMVRHYLEPEEYLRWYEDEPKESTVGDEVVPKIGEVIERAAYLLQNAKELEEQLGRPVEVLDLGCNDYWLGCYLAMNGVRCDGVELNRKAYEIGLERQARFAEKDPLVGEGQIWHGDLHRAPELVDGKRYDLVSLFEVLEHVQDPTHTLAVMESLLKPGGRVCVTTPNGAFERGQISWWAEVERKNHLRAIPAHELAETVLERGEVDDFRVHHADGRLTFVAYTPTPRKGKVVFFAGGAWEPWSPLSINQGGLGGSETALVQVATRLAQDGYTVKVYSGAEPGLVAGVLYRPHTAFDPGEDCDAMIVSRIPAAFDAEMSAPIRALWCHDHSYPEQLTEKRVNRMTHIVTLSDWEKDRFADLYPHAAEKLIVIRNGITIQDLDGASRYPDADRGFDERAPRCVYSSSADRGLDTLLEMWPRIRRRVPDAELHVFYGWEVFDRVAAINPPLVSYKEHVLALVEQLGGEQGGVFMRGRLGQADLAAEMQQARVWAYPTAFLETSCIGAMEARAAGLAIVTSDLGALHETVGAHGTLIPWDGAETDPVNRGEAYRDTFVDQVVEALRSEHAWTEIHDRGRVDVAGLDWSLRVAEWKQLIESAQVRELAAA